MRVVFQQFDFLLNLISSPWKWLALSDEECLKCSESTNQILVSVPAQARRPLTTSHQHSPECLHTFLSQTFRPGKLMLNVSLNSEEISPQFRNNFVSWYGFITTLARPSYQEDLEVNVSCVILKLLLQPDLLTKIKLCLFFNDFGYLFQLEKIVINIS